ncbi:DUF7529 family protein [Natronorubrum sulfidifaciens]|uniref:Uncharacterized protein n=1 Tax=Natronorubrum sulfidifaciens JCM 14089 TaxID=1230460 RepID=L9W4J7_9EURY|nr:hypothetical protein [Natronorubrum sulfidifaciens]ELY44389.1 hypothetical protein C495_10819 [Natronorubrum sulfidifaciens JCM 14089]
MPDDVSDPRTDRRRDPDEVQTDAWKQTLEDMEAIAEQRRDDGWSVVTVMAAHTDTVSRDMGDDDTFGLVHIIPDNYAAEFASTFDATEFTEYLAYGSDIQGYMYAVTEFIDSETDRSILLASRYDMTRAEGMVQSAEEEGVLYTHVKTVDGTVLGTFEHESYAPLIAKPNASAGR